MKLIKQKDFIRKLIIEEFNKLHWENIDDFIKACKLDGWAGKCGVFAIALNTVLFNKKGNYIIATNEHLWNNELRWIGHVCVEYDNYLYDSNGIVENIEHFESWGQPSEDDTNPITNKRMGELAYD